MRAVQGFQPLLRQRVESAVAPCTSDVLHLLPKGRSNHTVYITFSDREGYQSLSWHGMRWLRSFEPQIHNESSGVSQIMGCHSSRTVSFRDQNRNEVRRANRETKGHCVDKCAAKSVYSSLHPLDEESFVRNEFRKQEKRGTLPVRPRTAPPTTQRRRAHCSDEFVPVRLRCPLSPPLL